MEQKELTLQLRTRVNSLDILKDDKSGAWKIAQGNENSITTVQIFNRDCSPVITGEFDQESSTRINDGKLVVGFKEGYIKNWLEPSHFKNLNQVKYKYPKYIPKVKTQKRTYARGVCSF